MHHSRIVVVICAVGSTALASGARADDAIVVDATHPVRTLPTTFHGVNYVGFWDAAQGSAASAKALAATAIRVVRFAGGDPGDFYDWQCPYYTDKAVPACPTSPVSTSWSKTSPQDLWNWAKPFGGIPYFQTNYQGNVPNPPNQTYTANSPENAAAWARWAKQQAIPALFEIGNEEDIKVTQIRDPIFQPYITAFDAQAKAIHAVDPNIPVIGPAATNEYQWWNRDSLGMFLKAAGNKSGSGTVDGVSVHFYKGTAWQDTMTIPQYWSKKGGPWEFIQQTIQSNDTRPLPVYVSEWHLGASTGAMNSSTGTALITADMIGVFADSGLAGYHYFGIHGAHDGNPNYGLFYGAGESKPADTPTATAYALVLWKAMGDRVLPLTQSADPSTTVSAHATTRGDGSVQVMAINKTASTQPLAITWTGYLPSARGVDQYVVASIGDTTSPDVTYNGQKNPDITQALPAPKNAPTAGTAFGYMLPPYAAAVLDFAGTGLLPDAGSGGSGNASSSGGGSGGSAAGGSGSGSGTGASGGASSGANGSGASANAGNGAGGAAAPGGTGGAAPASTGGCGCACIGTPRAVGFVGLATAGALAAVAVRRRRSRR
jgi:hypothetical protein